MYKFCDKCGHTIAYEPYFKAYLCRQCGHYEIVKEKDLNLRYRKTWSRRPKIAQTKEELLVKN